MNRLETTSTIYLEMVVSHLRNQIATLHHALEAIERTHDYEDAYFMESLKVVEGELRRLRKSIEEY
jgi:hypothetical protein